MNYVVFDLEWNQAANETVQVTEPVYLLGEIVEIGAVKLDDSFRPIDELRVYVKPQYYTKLHRKIASLTHIRDKDLEEKGRPFPEICREFLDWCGEEFTFLTWSDSDLPELIDNMILHGMDISRLPPCCDVQRVFNREIMRSDHSCSLDAALEVLGEKGDEAHDALHDSRNTVKVCDHLDLESYIGEYSAQVFAEQPNLRAYGSEGEILADPQAAAFACPWCGEPLTTEGWVSMGFHQYAAMGTCPEEDEFLLMLECIRCQDGSHRYRRLVYEMSDDLWDRYQDRLELVGVN